MSTSLDFLTDNIYLLRVTGELEKSDLDAVQADFVQHLSDAGAIRLLVLLENFTGWAKGGAWEDTSFFFSHGDMIEKIALVGDPRWEAEMMAFAGAGIRKGQVRFFPGTDETAARGWIAE